MTKRLGAAFSAVVDDATCDISRGKQPSRGAVLVVDEADALAQSRDFDQMHHEDRAGVNALIRGIDSLAPPNVVAICLMCTNRLDALDPAVRRRAALALTFERPTLQQREMVLRSRLGSALTDEEFSKVAEATGDVADRPYAYTFSDLRDRLIPEILLRAVESGPITLDMALEAIVDVSPTPPFGAAT